MENEMEKHYDTVEAGLGRHYDSSDLADLIKASRAIAAHARGMERMIANEKRCSGCDTPLSHCTWSINRGAMKCCPDCKHGVPHA